jgi:hypothetical protein
VQTHISIDKSTTRSIDDENEMNFGKTSIFGHQPSQFLIAFTRGGQ